MEDNKEEFYDVVFDQLEPQDKQSIDAMNSILKADLSIVVSIGQASQSIESILNLKEDSVIILEKLIDEQLDVYINDKKVAYGESVIIDDKIAVRLTKVQETDDN